MPEHGKPPPVPVETGSGTFPRVMISAGKLLGRVLRAAGVGAVYGEPLARVEVVPVADPGVARLLAAAHRRVRGRTAMTHVGGVLWHTSDRVLDVDHPADLGDAVARVAGGDGLRLLFELDQPVADVAPPAPAADRRPEIDDATVAALTDAAAPMVLAGPGVVADGAVPGLHALAGAGSLGVLNPWGAKGVFDWRSRHHLATAGLQARDFDLGGVTGADVVVASGVDPLEAPDPLWRDGRTVLDIPPASLDRLAERWSRPERSIEVPPLRAGLAAVTQEGWAATSAPMPPTQVTRNYGLVGSGGGLVAADPGIAGYWVARTFATTELGGVVVPAEAGLVGFAAACCVVARLQDPGRAVLAAVDEAPDAVLEVAASLGVAVPVEVWTPDGAHLDADAHTARLRSTTNAVRTTIDRIATDARQLERMVAVAGEIIAWTG
jgi:hypothetical protein